MIKLGTVFSGIGAIEHALQRMNIEHAVTFACDNGDVDILSRTIKTDITDIREELGTLNSLITNIKAKEKEDIEYKNRLGQDLVKCKDFFSIIEKKLSCIDTKNLNMYCTKTLKKILAMPNLKVVRHKEYEMFLSEITKAKDTTDKNLKSIKYLLEVISDFSKDNELSKIENCNDFEYKSVDNIRWIDIIKDIKVVYFFLEEIKAKKFVNDIKEVCEKLSMLHERINSFHILKELSEIPSYEEKKDYVDSLYRSKESQNKVKQSYLENYNIDEKNFHWNISFLDGKQYAGQVDLFVGGSPCQSFSLVGKKRGLEDTRGTLFYEYARLVKEISPKVFIYENVKAVMSNDDGRTWDTMKKVFTDLDYKWDYKILNSKDYGIPQNRERLFVIGFRNDLKLTTNFEFPKPFKLDKTMQDFLLDNVSGKYYLNKKGVAFVTSEKNLSKRYTQIDGDVQLCQKKNQQFNWHGDFVFVEENSDMEKTMKNLEKYFLSEKVKKYVLASGTKGFYSKPETDLEIARPLLTTMHKMHRAGVDNYVTSDGRLRKLTPRECLRLMGFCDSFKIVVSDTAMYQQAGNSIVVDVLVAIMKSICECYPALLKGRGE